MTYVGGTVRADVMVPLEEGGEVGSRQQGYIHTYLHTHRRMKGTGMGEEICERPERLEKRVKRQMVVVVEGRERKNV